MSFKNLFTAHQSQCCKVLFFKIQTFESAVSFINVKFNSIAQFSECDFQKEVNFFDSVFLEILELKNSIFHYVNMKSIHFKREANFSNCKFQNEVDFSNSTFYEKANFKEAIFNASAYFDQADFMRNADFERSEFCKNAHFYQTKFSQNPIFFQAMFNEHLNLTDTLIFNFDFEGLKGEVQTCSEADKFRDVFKNIKNALIKSGNLLGASRFRKMELYCKEIELDLKKKENRETSTRDFVDRIQLYCYRLTSDHHTDLLLILNNVIFLIALFGVVNLGLDIYIQDITIDCIVAKIYKVEIWEIFIVTLIFITISLCFMLKLKLIEIVILSLILVICFVFLYYQVFLNIFLVLGFVCAAFLIYLFPFTFRTCVALVSYPIVMAMLIFKPKLLMPIMGKLIENENFEYYCVDSLGLYFNTFSFAFGILNFAYMLLLFLLLFSLQKTARKNTIVPN
ncbi:MAG: pentapeptide repeat-containing protein [Helicobacter sp.]|nr:pentapeptide repeat-containing protein [Helicobacter sp.]